MNALNEHKRWLVLFLWLLSAAAIWYFVPRKPKLEVVGRPAGFSDNGAVFVALQGDGSARFFDPSTGKELSAERRRELAGKLSGLNAPCAFDGRVWVQQQIGEAKAATLTIWDIGTAKRVATLKQGRNHAYVLSPDGTTLAYINAQGQSVLCDVATGKTRANIGSRVLTFSPDGAMFATLSAVGPRNTRTAIQLWDAKTGVKLKELTGHESPQFPLSLSFSPDGKRLASGCSQPHLREQLPEVKIWDVETSTEWARIEHPSDASRVHFGPRGQTLTVSSNLMTLSDYYSLWDVAQTPPRALFDGKTGILPQRTSEISPNGMLLARPRAERIEFLSLPGLEKQREVFAGRVFRIGFAPDSTKLALLSGNRAQPSVQVIDVTKGTRIASTWELPAGAVREFEISPDGATLMTSSYTRVGKHWDDSEDNRTIRLWDIPPARPFLTIGLIWLGSGLLCAGVYFGIRHFATRLKRHREMLAQYRESRSAR